MISPINTKTCCPPGPLRAPNQLPHLVVAAMMRSGTHMAINLILNNFSQYRRNPLYVNLDIYLHQGGMINALEKAGGSVVKTHFPQSIECKGHEAVIHEFFGKCKVILVKRDPEQVKNSLSKFGNWGKNEVAKFDELATNFTKYWDSRNDYLIVNHSDLIDPEKVGIVVKSIAEFIGMPVPTNVIGPRCKKHRWRILFDKALTRLFGSLAPRANTGIKLGVKNF